MKDRVLIITTFLAPLFAVQATQYVDRRRQRRSAQMQLFSTLMATRATNLSPRHVEALNLIDVVFYSKRRDDKQIRDVWKQYLDHLGTDQTTNPNWGNRRIELFVDLLRDGCTSGLRIR